MTAYTQQRKRLPAHVAVVIGAGLIWMAWVSYELVQIASNVIAAVKPMTLASNLALAAASSGLSAAAIPLWMMYRCAEGKSGGPEEHPKTVRAMYFFMAICLVCEVAWAVKP